MRFISIVNNHVADSGDPAELVKALEKRGKTVIGPENPSRTQTVIGGMGVDFFSAYFLLPRVRVSYRGPIATALEKMIGTSDAERRVVNLHWGYEHTVVPAPFQRDLAHRLVEAGANLIVGHHPHVPQGWEIYHGAPIFYSLGNFNFWQFDKSPIEENKWGYMVRYDLKTGNAEPVPYRINENYQPFPVSGQERDDLAIQLNRLSQGVGPIDSRTWFAVHYKKWRAHEFHVWMERCRKTKRPSMMLKFMIWLILPMQIWFYGHMITNLLKESEST